MKSPEAAVQERLGMIRQLSMLKLALLDITTETNQINLDAISMVGSLNNIDRIARAALRCVERII